MPTEARSAPVDPACGFGSLKVVFVLTRGDSIGGAQIHVRDLSAHLVRDGATAVVLVGSTGPFTDDLEARGVRWRLCPGLARSVNPLRDIRALREVHRALLIERPQLVSSHTAKAGLVGRLAAWWAGIPAVFTAHGWQFVPGIPLAQRAVVYALELVLSRFSARVITVSRFDFRLARRSAAVPRARLRLVYNGLPDVAAPPHRAEGQPPRLIMTARFQQQKDHATLLRALAQVELPWLLQLVGEEGPLSADIRAQAHRLGLLDSDGLRRVEFLGHRSDVAALLAAADMYCLISHWEGLPRSIIEAMRAAIPVVASDVGGVAELLRDGATGYLVRRGDAACLAERLRQLLGDPAQRQRMGREGRARYESLFTFDAMYRRTLDVWREVIPASYQNS